jgi:alginate O-acetyltransferase complex protein AlgJ
VSANYDQRSARWDSRATVLTCLIVLWLPFVVGLLSDGSRAVSTAENRRLATAPALPTSLAELRTIPARAETYFDDRLGLRDSLIRAHAWLHVAGLGISPSDKLIVGKQGWFFFNHPNAVAQHQGSAEFSREQLEAWKVELTARRDWLAQRGIAYLFVLAPNKHAIYPEFMPDRIARGEGADPHTRLAAFLAAESDLNVVDLKPALLDRKQTERVYHKTDTHWNDRGAYLAYREIIAAAAQSLANHPAVGTATPVHAISRQTPGMGLTSIVGLSRYYTEENLSNEKSSPRARVKPEHARNFKQREQNLLPLALGVEDRSLPRAVVFRDSFANALVPYLSENFSRIVFTWNRDLDLRLIQIEQPDIVIHEVVGRFLEQPPEAFERLTQRAAVGRGRALDRRGERRD